MAHSLPARCCLPRVNPIPHSKMSDTPPPSSPTFPRPGSSLAHALRLTAATHRPALACWLNWWHETARIPLDVHDAGVAETKLRWWVTELQATEQGHPNPADARTRGAVAAAWRELAGGAGVAGPGRRPDPAGAPEPLDGRSPLCPPCAADHRPGLRGGGTPAGRRQRTRPASRSAAGLRPAHGPPPGPPRAGRARGLGHGRHRPAADP